MTDTGRPAPTAVDRMAAVDRRSLSGQGRPSRVAHHRLLCKRLRCRRCSPMSPRQPAGTAGAARCGPWSVAFFF